MLLFLTASLGGRHHSPGYLVFCRILSRGRLLLSIAIDNRLDTSSAVRRRGRLSLPRTVRAHMALFLTDKAAALLDQLLQLINRDTGATRA